MSIIREAQSFSMDTYYNKCDILNNPVLYFESIKKDWEKTRNIFPLLELVMPPYAKERTIFLRGILLSQKDINFLHLDVEDYSQYGLPIIAIIPENYQKIGLMVYDCSCRIQWKEVPKEIKHCNKDKKGSLFICTHHQHDINKNNCFLNVLQSAYYLFIEYKRYDKHIKFELKCLPHGNCYGR